MPTQQDELKLYLQIAGPDSRLKIYAVVVDALGKLENPFESGLTKNGMSLAIHN